MAKASGARRETLYSVHPGVAMMQKWVSELKGKTGRSLDEWITLVKSAGPEDEKDRRAWLKSKYQLGTNSVWWIAEQAEGRGSVDADPARYLKAAALYVEQQYSGPKAKLRPIYDALLELGRSLGPDVKACPCKTIVPLYRQHVFAQIKPATNARDDLGLALTRYRRPLPGRLIDTNGLAKKDRITHRVELKSVDEIDREVQKWLKLAYELDAATV